MINSTLLSLMPLSENDRELFISIYTDPQLMRNVAPAFNKNKILSLFGNAIKTSSKNIFYVISNNLTHQSIGIIGFLKNQKSKSSLELGVMISNNYSSKGYAFKATHMLIDYAFRFMEITSVVVFCKPENKAANRISEALGFINSGIILDEFTHKQQIKWEITVGNLRKI